MVMWLTQSHTASKCLTWEQNPVSVLLPAPGCLQNPRRILPILVLDLLFSPMLCLAYLVTNRENTESSNLAWELVVWLRKTNENSIWVIIAQQIAEISTREWQNIMQWWKKKGILIGYHKRNITWIIYILILFLPKTNELLSENFFSVIGDLWFVDVSWE